MIFRHPAFFLLLLLIPFIWTLAKRRQKLELPFSTFSCLEKRPWTLRMMLYKMLPCLRVLVLILLITAMARPCHVSSDREFQTHGLDIMISLDLSGSMLAEDFQPENRIYVAKQEAVKFIQGRENDRIGLVVFAKKAFTQCPLTLDYRILIELLSELRVGMIADGTAIGMGIATAVNRLRDSDAKSKVLILITDGANNSGNIDPITAAELARTFDIKIYTIAVGRGGLVPFPIDDPLFGKRYVQANVEIDEMTLKRIADITGGLFFRARDPQSLSEIYEKINRLEKSEVKVKEYKSYKELFPIFLVPALLFLLIDILFRQTVLLKVP